MPVETSERLGRTALIGILLLGSIVVGSWIVRDLKAKPPAQQETGMGDTVKLGL